MRRLPLIVALAFALLSCVPSNDAPPTTDPSSEPQPATGATATSAPVEPSPPAVRAPLLPEGSAFIARPTARYTPMWERPGAGEPDFSLDTRNPFDQIAPLLIDDAVRRNGEPWYEVLLPLRPNGTTAWVRAEDVTVRERRDRIEVDLSERMLWRYRGDRLIERFRVGVGTERYPTGTGRFYIWVKVPYEDPNNPYGIMALGLSGFSPELSDWPGEGRMAVHGTPYASDRGQRVSHGCVRVFNDDMLHLVDLPLGTPVEIRP